MSFGRFARDYRICFARSHMFETFGVVLTVLRLGIDLKLN